MNNISSPIKLSVIFGIPLLLLGSLFLCVQSSLFNNSSVNLSLAITVDLLITIPIIYFLLIRKTTIPKTTVVPMMILGLLIGYFILPLSQQYYLDLFKVWVLPVIEISIATFVIVRIRGIVKSFKIKPNEGSIDFFCAAKKASSEVLPVKMVHAFATEMAVFYYGFVKWKKHELKENEYSYHNKSTITSVLLGFTIAILFEAFGIHFILVKWNVTVAWIFTALSIYTLFQILGFSRSLSHRPSFIQNDNLHLRYGIMGETTICIDHIECIELTTKDFEVTKINRRLSPFGSLENHNIILHLKEENILTGLYGFKRPFEKLCFHLDDPIRFKESIELKKHENETV